MIDNCIFDFDHTLVDTDRAFAEHRQSLADQLQLLTGLEDSVLADALKETASELETQFFAARLDLINRQIVSMRVKKLSEGDLRNIAANVKAAYYAGLRVSEPILTMLNATAQAGKKLYMFTGGSPAHTADKLIGSGLWRFFKIVFTGDLHPFEDRADSGLVDAQSLQKGLQKFAPIISLGPNPKSSARAYRRLLDQAGLDARRTLMIGNHLRDDILSSQQAGLFSAQATWFNKDVSIDVIPDLVLSDPMSLFS